MSKLTSRQSSFHKIAILFGLSKMCQCRPLKAKTLKTSFLMATDQCTRQEIETCHTALSASASFPRWQYQAAKHHSQPTIL